MYVSKMLLNWDTFLSCTIKELFLIIGYDNLLSPGVDPFNDCKVIVSSIFVMFFLFVLQMWMGCGLYGGCYFVDVCSYGVYVVQVCSRVREFFSIGFFDFKEWFVVVVLWFERK